MGACVCPTGVGSHQKFEVGDAQDLIHTFESFCCFGCESDEGGWGGKGNKKVTRVMG